MRANPIQSIGLISDTHGLLRPEALDALRGCGRIVHAGDICDPSVLQALAELAPVIAVRGNNDRGDWAAALPASTTLQVGTVRIQVIHDLAELGTPSAGVVVSGHSHKPSVVRRDGCLYVNPGSAGPRRFKLPISLGRLRIDGDRVEVELIDLATGRPLQP